MYTTLLDKNRFRIYMNITEEIQVKKVQNYLITKTQVIEIENFLYSLHK